jgi:hypothetical protein
LAINGEVTRQFYGFWLQRMYQRVASKSSFHTSNRHRLTETCIPGKKLYFSGPEPTNIPAIISSAAPVDWDYHGEVFNLKSLAGITEVGQDPSDGTLASVMSWFVTQMRMHTQFKVAQLTPIEIACVVK